MRQQYSIEVLQNILNQYENLGQIQEYSLFTSGYENSNYYIKTEQGQFVIKIFEGIGIKKENILFELEVMEYSFKSGIKSPSILFTIWAKNHVVFDDKFAILMPLIEGQNMHKQKLPDSLVIEAGMEAGKMDTALKHFKDGSKTRQGYVWDLKNTLLLEESLKYLPEKYNHEILKGIFNEFRAIKNKFEQMPMGLIHNDIVPHNWLVKEGRLNGIIDFSDIEFSPYIQNVAVSLHLTAFCYNWNPLQAKLFVGEYIKYNSLSKEELSILYILVKARFLAFVVEFNRWNEEYEVDPLRVETVDDHYNFLKRFIEFGPKAFNQLLDI